MYALVCVLDNPSHLNAVLDGWSEAGVQGITVLESTGMQRVRERIGQKDKPWLMSFSRLLRTDEYCHNTLFAVVDDMDTVHRAVAATEAITGDLRKPHTGILFACPVEATWGLPKEYNSPSN